MVETGQQALRTVAATACAQGGGMTAARIWLGGLLEALVHTERRLSLLAHRGLGTAHRLTASGWGPVIRWLAIAAAALYLLDWLTFTNVLTATAIVLAWRWLRQARDRVVIEDFVDFTHDDPQAVKGLATLLVAELGRLHELYGRVNDQLSTPMSLGVRRRGGIATGTEPGSFLSVRADDVTGALNDAVASESRIQVGGINLPVGFLFGIVGRFARGPRIMGSVHVAEGDGAVIAAQVVGPGGGRQWRVEADTPAASVPELAARMFNDLTLRGSVRAAALRSFTRSLELYWASHRTPRDRARNLRLAEGELLQAIAEDERFDLAFYNLGVVYSKLAETEQQAAQASDYVGAGDDPEASHAARLDAAVAAFDRAVALNRDRAEAVYALAVHEFARTSAISDRDAIGDLLDCVICRCDRVLELDPRHAHAHDLKGMALRRAGRSPAAERSHRRAVVLSWRRVRSAGFAECASPPVLESALPAAKANLAAALDNLAHVQKELPGWRGVRQARADRLYRRAADLARPPPAPPSTTCAGRCSATSAGGARRASASRRPSRSSPTTPSTARRSPARTPRRPRSSATRTCGLRCARRQGCAPRPRCTRSPRSTAARSSSTTRPRPSGSATRRSTRSGAPTGGSATASSRSASRRSRHCTRRSRTPWRGATRRRSAGSAPPSGTDASGSASRRTSHSRARSAGAASGRPPRASTAP
jgi:hypothetical protein